MLKKCIRKDIVENVKAGIQLRIVRGGVEA
jgi:hypothetical protein